MMTRFMSVAVFVVLLCGCGGVSECPYAALEKEGFVQIFDGESFAGWEGDKSSFRVEDGAIVGGSLEKAIPRNEFLCTLKEYSDFELRLSFKLVGEGNAGIQIRSRRVAGSHEMIGYQADIGMSYWGALYDESRRKRMLAKPDEAELEKVLRRDGWNDYRIRCEGKRVEFWLNGYKTVDYVEPEAGIEQVGLIGLQVHGGGPSEIWYKDIVLKQL